MEETSSRAVEHSLRLREARAVGVKCVGRQNALHQLELELLEGHSDLADTCLPDACVNASHTDIQNTPHRSRSSSLSLNNRDYLFVRKQIPSLIRTRTCRNMNLQKQGLRGAC